MNRVLVVFLLILNVALCLYLFRFWKTLMIDEQEEFTSISGWKPPEESQPNTAELFIATNEWKPLGKDQPIPKGLHVRINLQTGEREAKLLSAESDAKKTEDEKTSVVLLTETMNGVERIDYDNGKYMYLQEALKKGVNETNDDGKNQDEQPKKKFRTYEELKKDMAELKMNIKTDLEVLDEVFRRFHESNHVTEKWCSLEEPNSLSILSDLENLLHQVDNAREFSKQNGMADIIVPCLSSNSTKLRTSAARVLGAAVQNNPRVQIAALQAGVIPLLLKNIALEKNYEVRATSIFALSCLVRSFPLAEMNLIDEGGLSVLLSLFDESSAELLKLQMKVVTFFYDLIMEKEDAELTLEEDMLLRNASDGVVVEELKLAAEKLKQYNNIGLKSRLVDRGWCTKLSNLLVDRVSNKNGNIVDHDTVDKILNAMLPVAIQCKDRFTNQEAFYQSLIRLSEYYKNLSMQDDFYKGISTLIHTLCARLNLK